MFSLFFQNEAKVEPTSLTDTLELVVVVSSLLEEDTDHKRIASLLLESLAPIAHKGTSYSFLYVCLINYYYFSSSKLLLSTSFWVLII